MTQPSTTTQILYPALRYADAPAAIRWLCEAFGFTEQAVYAEPDGAIAHAQLAFGGGVVMLGSSRESPEYPVRAPGEVGGLTGSIYVYVADPDAHYARAKAYGARIARELNDTDYDAREYSAYDCEGHFWTFGTYRA